MNTRVLLQPVELTIRLYATSLAVVTQANVSGIEPARFPLSFSDGTVIDKHYRAHHNLAMLIESAFTQTQSSLNVNVIDDFAQLFLGIKHRIDAIHHYKIMIVRRSDGILPRAITPFGTLSTTQECAANARLKSLAPLFTLLSDLALLLRSEPTPCN